MNKIRLFIILIIIISVFTNFIADNYSKANTIDYPRFRFLREYNHYQTGNIGFHESCAYSGYYNEKDKSYTISCSQIENGKELWSKQFEKTESVDLALDSTNLYYTLDEGYVFCVDLVTGNEKWNFKAPFHFFNSCRIGWIILVL